MGWTPPPDPLVQLGTRVMLLCVVPAALVVVVIAVALCRSAWRARVLAARMRAAAEDPPRTGAAYRAPAA